MDETVATNAQQNQNIKAQLDALIELQRLDDEITQRTKKVEQCKADVQAEDKALTQQREQLASRKKEMEQLQLERRQAETTAKQKTEEIQKLGGQLFDVKTNEAYTTLQREIQQKKKDNGLLEEHILELMVAEDEIKVKVKQAETELKQGEQQVIGKQVVHKQALAEVETEINQFQAQWDTASKKVRSDFLDLYLRLRKAKEGKALARIENDVCTGCRLSIRPQASIELKKYRSLLYCDNCARILYAD